MKQIIISLFLFSLISCYNNHGNENNNANTDFNKFIDLLPELKLPVKINCGLENVINTDDFTKFKKYIPKNAERIYGYIKKDSFKLIIYGYIGDDIYPYLYSYNSEGKIIDSLSLIINPCGAADDKRIPNSYAIIDKTLTIKLIDTTRFIHYVNNSQMIVDSFRITKVVTQINEDGFFKKIN